MSRSRISIRATSKIHADLQEAFRKIWIIIILCAETTEKNQRIIQLLRPLTNQWQSNLIRVIHNLAPERKEEELIMRILIVITILPNLHSAFKLMEIIIITNVNPKRKINDHLKIKEKFQQSSAWLQPFQEITKWPLSSNTSNPANSNTSPSTNHSNHLHNNRSLTLFLTTLLSSTVNLNKISITNIILIIRHIQDLANRQL